MSDKDEGEEKGRKTESEVDRHSKCGLEGQGTVGRGDASKTGLCGGNWSYTSTPHRSLKRCGGRRCVHCCTCISLPSGIFVSA